MLLASLLLTATLASLVDAPTQWVADATISEAVEQGVRSRLIAAGSPATVEVVGRIQEQQVPAGEVSIALGDIAGRWPREKAGVPVQLHVDGRHVRSMTVWVELHDRREALTYAQDYPATTSGADIQVRSEVVDLMCCPGAVAPSADALAGRRIVQGVREGRPVLLADLEAAPDVRAQSEVAIVVQRGSIRITTKGIALDDGVVGEWIAVRPEQSRVAVRSQVVGEQKVVVNE